MNFSLFPTYGYSNRKSLASKLILSFELLELIQEVSRLHKRLP